MFKFIIICILVGYVLYKIASSIKVFVHTNNYQRPPQYKPPGSNVNIETPPPSKKNDGKDFKGGEYVDYEEIK
jgi:hypothetical protein